MNGKSNNTLQAFWAMLGSIGGFMFTILSSMILSRYFNKEDYGTYKQVMYVYNSLLLVFTLGLPKAFSFFLPRVPNEHSKDLIDKLNYILLALGLLMSIFLFLGAGLISKLLGNSLLAEPLQYFSLIPFLMLPTMGMEGILSTFKQTKFLAIYTTLTKTFILLCVVIPVIVYKGGVNSAIIGFTVSSFLCFLLAMYFKYLPVKSFKKERTFIKYPEILRYTLPIMAASLWGIVISTSDQFFISRYFGSEVFADFSNGALQLPFIGMIISAGSLVLSPVFSKHAFEKEKDSKKEVMRIWISVYEKSAKLIYPLVVFFFVFANTIMVVIYGKIYESSGIYFQIKTFANFFDMIMFAPLVLSIGGQKYYFKVHMFIAMGIVLLEWLSVLYINSPIAIVVISVFFQITKVIAMLWYVAKYFELKIIELFPIKLILELLISTGIILYTVKFVLTTYFDLNNILLLISAGIIYALLFGLWAFYRKIDYYSIIKPLFQKIKSN